MPRVLSYTPPWLAHGTTGCAMFTPKSAEQQAGRPSSSSFSEATPPFKGARRTIAQRGTEVFVAVGNTIRWADLALLKDEWESKHGEEKLRASKMKGAASIEEEDEDPIESLGFKNLKVAVHEPIRQLVPSPYQNLLAVVTSHTVHIAVIPDSTHLDQPDAGPLKVRTYMLGPTVHVLSQAPIVAALWHPLGDEGTCLVTITDDAVVRLWELDVNNRASFDQPTIDLDLAKLHYAKSVKDPIKSHRMGENRGFSMDRLGMRAAAAAFGGTGSDAEHGWSPMTLWVAMDEGDVYALCPLLPTRWRAPTLLVDSLTTAVMAKKAYAEGNEAHEEERRIFAAQEQWTRDIDKQEPVLKIAQDPTGYEWRMPIYRRPSKVSAIPRLQGPFRILPGDVEDDLYLAGIHVLPPKLDTEELVGDDDDGLLDMYDGGLSATVVCLISSSGRVYVTLCLEDIEGQWLPAAKPVSARKPKGSPKPTDEDAEERQPQLILLEALDTLRPPEVTEHEWPTITPDVFSRYAFFLTHSHGVFYLSLEPWVQRLEDELQAAQTHGTQFRMAALTKGAMTLRERLVRFEHHAGPPLAPTAAACVFDDSDLGYFLLTAHGTRPEAAILDHPASTMPARPATPPADPAHGSPATSPPAALASAFAVPPRQPWQPPPLFWSHRTQLSTFLRDQLTAGQRATLHGGGPVRLTGGTLEIFTSVHRATEHETRALATAAADLFRRCARLTAELSAQVRNVRDSGARIAALLGDDADVDVDDEEGDDPERDRGVAARLAGRLARARTRADALQARHDALRARVARLGTRPLSELERAWGLEVARLAAALDAPDAAPDATRALAQTGARERGKTAYRRFAEVQSAVAALLADVERLQGGAGSEAAGSDAGDEAARDDARRGASAEWAVPAEVRRGRLAQVRGLLEREAAVVEGVRERLARLEA